MLPFISSRRLNLACLLLLRGSSDAYDAHQADPAETYNLLGSTVDPDTFAELKSNETENAHYMQAIVNGEGRVREPPHY